MVLGTTGGTRGNQLLRMQHCKGTGLMQSCNVPFRQVATILKFLQGAGGFFKKPPLPLGERKTCLQVAFLMGLPVKSAFALLLTRVTEQRTV